MRESRRTLAVVSADSKGYAGGSNAQASKPFSDTAMRMLPRLSGPTGVEHNSSGHKNSSQLVS